MRSAPSLNIHGKELGSILFNRSLDKKYPDLASTRFRIHGVFQKFPLLWRADSKSCGFVCLIHRIRVDGSRIRKEKVADSKSIQIRVRRVDGASMHFLQYYINALRHFSFDYGNVTSRREFWENVSVHTRLRGHKGKPTMTNLISPLEVLSLTITPDVYIAHVTFYSVKTFLI